MPPAMQEPEGINKLPDELLFQIISFVPYVPNANADQCPHLAIKLLSRRFNRIASSPSLRRDIVRFQFTELALLNNAADWNVSDEDLEYYAQRDQDVQSAIDKVLKPSDTPKARRAITLGLHVLCCMSTFVDGERFELNMYLMSWCIRSILSQEWFSILRYTIQRIYDHMLPTEDDFAASCDQGDYWESETTGHTRAFAQLFKRRGFETAVLTNLHWGPLLHCISQGRVRPYMDIGLMYFFLREALGYMTPDGQQINGYGAPEETLEATLNFVKGRRWRLLSPWEDDPGVQVEPGVQPEIWKAFQIELDSDVKLRKDFEDPSGSQDLNAKATDLKEIGSKLTAACDHIIGRSVPRRLRDFIVEKQVTDVSLLETWYDSDDMLDDMDLVNGMVPNIWNILGDDEDDDGDFDDMEEENSEDMYDDSSDDMSEG
ncbi:hypothetical protein PMZ80_006700 [Knufia obscura]|uniref:F-box domain-containing protein n=1 Tax=Knufia obscura TaxID=1635080 RepID=A0ABR0RM25_9EURO|nr:hypothetical protein PMZ80_006700 [Knufia obscura]